VGPGHSSRAAGGGSQRWPFAYLIGGVAALPFTLIAAELSYRFVEQPVRQRLHGRFAPHRARVPGPRLIAGEQATG
jgi:peptidoglycan/LPS O-acetylase OafA/YrhL